MHQQCERECSAVEGTHAAAEVLQLPGTTILQLALSWDRQYQLLSIRTDGDIAPASCCRCCAAVAASPPPCQPLLQHSCYTEQTVRGYVCNLSLLLHTRLNKHIPIHHQPLLLVAVMVGALHPRWGRYATGVAAADITTAQGPLPKCSMLAFGNCGPSRPCCCGLTATWLPSPLLHMLQLLLLQLLQTADCVSFLSGTRAAQL